MRGGGGEKAVRISILWEEVRLYVQVCSVLNCKYHQIYWSCQVCTDCWLLYPPAKKCLWFCCCCSVNMISSFGLSVNVCRANSRGLLKVNCWNILVIALSPVQFIPCRTIQTMPPLPTVKHFDYLVLGGGSGGIASARRAAEFGVKVREERADRGDWIFQITLSSPGWSDRVWEAGRDLCQCWLCSQENHVLCQQHEGGDTARC